MIEDDRKPCPHCSCTAAAFDAQEGYCLPLGTLLHGRYEIGGMLGFGGFGITYRAWDHKMETVVAVKEYYPSGIAARTPNSSDVMIYAKRRRDEFLFGKNRFLAEAQNMAKFSSEPNIVNVFDFFEENNTAYIVMEYLDGISLSTYLHQNGGRIDIDSAVQVTEHIANALHRIHHKGIIHRDVSPDNIFLCGGGAIKLIDFGAARFSQDENKLMTIILKPGFAPPEQYEKVNAQGPWTDVYALGATLYYSITGQKPEESTNRRIKDTLRCPHEINSEIPAYLSNTIMKAMAVEKHLRFQNVQDFLDALHQERRVLPIAVEKKHRSRRRLLSIIGAAAAIVFGTGLSVFAWQRQRAETILPDSHIVMWYCMSGDAAMDGAEQNAYETIISSFQESFPNVQITLEGFSAEQYADALQNSEVQPNLYEYNGVRAVAAPLPLQSVYQSDAAKQCRFFSQMEQTDLLPLGFEAPVVFQNTLLMDDESVLSNGLSDASLFETDAQAFLQMYEGLDDRFYVDAQEHFLNEKTPLWGTMTSQYFSVTEALPAQYRVIPCNAQEVPCSYTNIWAAADRDDAENKAAIKLLTFMLHTNAQDVLHIQNRSTGFPINDEALAVYVSVHDDFKSFFDNRECYRIDQSLFADQ